MVGSHSFGLLIYLANVILILMLHDEASDPLERTKK